MLVMIVNGSIFAWTKTPVVDEVGHVGAGLHHWQTGDRSEYSVNPPLPRLVATSVCYLAGLRCNPDLHERILTQRTEFQMGRDVFERYGLETRLPLFLARIVSLFFVSLGIPITMLWARQVGGTVASLVAGGLWAFSPMMVSHGSVITPDAWAAAGGVGWVFLLRSWSEGESNVPAWTLGLTTGLLMCIKFTWVPIGCAVILLACVRWWAVRRNGALVGWDAARLRLTRANRMFGALSAIFVCGLTIWSIYNFADFGTAIGDIPLRSRWLRSTQTMQAADQNVGLPNRFSNTWIASMPTPVPPVMLRGIDYQKGDMEDPPWPRSYLMGQWRDGGWPHYYAIAFLVKSPITLLVLTGCGFFAFLFHKANQKLIDAVWIALPILLIFALVSSNTGFNRHLRYVLPMYPFIFIMAGIGAARLVKFIGTMAPAAGSLSPRSGAAAIFIALVAFEFYCAAPHWMSYFNLAVGQNGQGSRWLLGSNVDWNQHIYSVANWIDENPEKRPVYVALDGETPEHWFGVDCRCPDVRYRDNGESEKYVELPFQRGWYLISYNRLLRDVQTHPGTWVHTARMHPETDVIAGAVVVLDLTQARYGDHESTQ